MHVVDGSAQQPEYEFEAVRLELELFSPSLVDKPYVVVYNKMDLPEASERWNTFGEKLQAQGIEPYCISAINQQGTQDVIHAAYKLLQKEKQRMKETEGAYLSSQFNCSFSQLKTIIKPKGAFIYSTLFLFKIFVLILHVAAEWSGPENLNHVSDAIKRERRAPMKEFEIFHDKGTNTWNVVGAGIERFVQMTNWQ